MRMIVSKSRNFTGELFVSIQQPIVDDETKFIDDYDVGGKMYEKSFVINMITRNSRTG